jgi:predicted DNA-binding protein
MVRNKKIHICFSNEEYERLSYKAKNLGMNISSYLRFLGLNARVISRVDIDGQR